MKFSFSPARISIAISPRRISISRKQSLLVFRLILSLFWSGQCFASETQWPQFQGLDGMSDAGNQNIPIEFGPDKNLLWHIAVPQGHSSPIIWGNTIFLSGYQNDARLMRAIDRQTGKLLWEKQVPALETEDFTHRLASPAEATPCTDGTRVYFYFGNYGLVALNFDGSLAWEKKLSKPRTGMGTGTSPILYGELLILKRDGTDDPCILALDAKTGDEIWKHPRIGYSTSHASPYIWNNKLRTELIIAGSGSLASLDPQTGKLIWRVDDTNAFPCTTPKGTEDLLFFAAWSANSAGSRDKLEAHFDDDLRITDEEMNSPELFFTRFDYNKDGVITMDEMPESRARDVFKWLDQNDNQLWEPNEFSLLTRPSGRGRNLMVTIRPGGEDVLNGTDFIAWEWKNDLPYVASPLVSENRIFLVKSMGIVSCLNTETGIPYFEGKRTGIKGEYFASPVKVGNKILIASNLGSIFVIGDREEFHILAHNKIDEEIIATPAVVDNTIYLRSLTSLWAFKEL
jgi:outer membrane protein assembly factor BamB